MAGQPRLAGRRLQNAQTSGNGLELVVNGRGREVTFYIFGTGTISSGAVQCEHAHEEGYSGTWATIGSVQTVVSGTVLAVSRTGCVGVVRARISTPIGGGGSVSVIAIVN